MLQHFCGNGNDYNNNIFLNTIGMKFRIQHYRDVSSAKQGQNCFKTIFLRQYYIFLYISNGFHFSYTHPVLHKMLHNQLSKTHVIEL